MLWTLGRDFLVNLAAGAVGELSSPSGMMGYLVALVFMGAMVIGWHRKRVSEGKRGMDSWYFIALALIVAITAVGTAAYGIGLRSSPQTKQAAQPSSLPEIKASEGPLQWDDHLGHGYAGNGSGDVITHSIQIGAVNGAEEIKLEEAYIISEFGDRIDMKVSSGRSNRVDARSTGLIPPNADILFSAEINPPNGLRAKDFFDQWKVMYLTVKLDGGKVVRKTIDERMISALYVSFRPNPLRLPPTKMLDLNRQEAPAPAEKPASTPYSDSILTARYYSKQNKETVAEILDRTSGVLSRKGEDIFTMAETAINRSAWDRPNENIQPMIDRMLTIEALTADLRRDLFEELYKQYPDFRVEINNLIFPFEPPANFENGAKNFKNALTVWNEHRNGLEGNQRQEFIQLVNTARGAFASFRQEFLKWATDRTTKIDQTRSALRQ